MAARSAEIVIKLVDQASGPAKNIAAALRGVQASAKAVNGTMVGRRGVGSGAAPGVGPGGALVPIAPGLRTMLGVGAGYGLGRQITKGFKDAADLDRAWMRLATTAEVSAAEVMAAQKQVNALANQYGLAQADAFAGFEALIVQGQKLPEALASMKAILATAQAAGAETADISKTAGALMTNMKVAPQDMTRAFDMLAYAGKAGQFELKDMAQYMPQLAASWSNVGQTGVDSLADLAAALQIVRKQTGTSEAAFNGVRDLLAKVYSKDVQKNFKEAGVDLEDGLKKAKAAGRPLLDTIAELTEKVTKGDLSQLPKFFGEIDSRNAVSALINLKREFQALRSEIRNTSAGTIGRDVEKFTTDTKSGLVRLSDSWSSFWRSIGRLADSAGATSALTAIGKAADGAADSLDRLSTAQGRLQAAQEFERNQKRGALDLRIREIEQKIEQRERVIRGQSDQPKASFPGRFQSGLKDQADRLRADPGSDPLIRELRDRLNGLIEERQRLINEEVARPVITGKDIDAGRKAIERDKAHTKMRERVPGLVPPKAQPAAQSWPAAPPVTAPDDAPVAPGKAAEMQRLGAAADDAGRKLDEVGSKTVAPTISLAGIEAANRQLAEMEARLNRIAGMRASPVVAPRIAPAPASSSGGGGGAPRAAGTRTAHNSYSDYPRRV